MIVWSIKSCIRHSLSTEWIFISASRALRGVSFFRWAATKLPNASHSFCSEGFVFKESLSFCSWFAVAAIWCILERGLNFLHEGGVSCDSPFCVFFGVAGAGSGSSTCVSSSDCGLVAPTLLGSVPISVTGTGT